MDYNDLEILVGHIDSGDVAAFKAQLSDSINTIVKMRRSEKFHLSAQAIRKEQFEIFTFLNENDEIKQGNSLTPLINVCLDEGKFKFADFLLNKIQKPFTRAYMERQIHDSIEHNDVDSIVHLINTFNDPRLTAKTFQNLLDNQEYNETEFPIEKINEVITHYTGDNLHEQDFSMHISTLEGLGIDYETLGKIVKPELALPLYQENDNTRLSYFKRIHTNPSKVLNG